MSDIDRTTAVYARTVESLMRGGSLLVDGYEQLKDHPHFGEQVIALLACLRETLETAERCRTDDRLFGMADELARHRFGFSPLERVRELVDSFDKLFAQAALVATKGGSA